MPEHTEQLGLAVPPQQALAILRAAAEQLVQEAGWSIKDIDAQGLAVAQSVGSLLSNNWPVTIRLTVEDAPLGSRVTLAGSNFGWGPIQSTAVRKRVQSLRDRVTALAENPPMVRAALAHSPSRTATPDSAPAGGVPAVAEAPPPDRIFISYRRSDSADVTGRIYDRLTAQFGKATIFKDVDSIPLGVDFRTHLQGVVGQCSVVLAIVGRDWIDVADDRGQRRLDDPGDYVRIELEGALKRRIPVVPLLVRGATMPPEDALPESLKPFAFRNGTPIRSDPDFHTDMDRLIEGLQDHLAQLV